MAGAAVEGRLVLVEPAVESLLRGVSPASAWPQGILGSPDLAAARERRLQPSARMQALDERIPDPTMAQGQVVALFEGLARVLEEEPLSRRLILYLPFEWLPDPGSRSAFSQVREAGERLARIHRQRWRELLAVSDVRANFVDGDILEPELGAGPPPRVVKAAHLLPGLVQRGLFAASEIGPLVEEAAGDDILLESLGDALAVMADLNLLGGKEIARLQQGLPSRPRGCLGDRSGPVSPARLQWQERRREEAARRLRAEDIAAESLSEPDGQRLIDLLTARRTEPVVVRIQAVGLAIERLAAADLVRARAIHQALDPLLQELWCSEGPEAKDALVSLWSRGQSLGAIDESHWPRAGLRRPRLDAAGLDDPELIALAERNLRALLDPPPSLAELRRLIHPAAIIFGSRLKGYAGQAADLDVAVLVKPGVPAADRPLLQELLARAGGKDLGRGKIVELWLEERGDVLQIQDLPDPDAVQGDSDWVHLLFGGAWYGQRAVIESLHARLLSPYLRSRRVGADGRFTRELWLEEMERDSLQYRLLHHGYARLFPTRGGIHTARSSRIDSSSTFWDAGYRRLASRLYLERVFLPLLEADGP
jgi:hypothetical protein